MPEYKITIYEEHLFALKRCAAAFGLNNRQSLEALANGLLEDLGESFRDADARRRHPSGGPHVS